MDKIKKAVEIRKEILEKTKQYYSLMHAEEQKPFHPGTDPVHYAGRVFDEHELCSLVDSSLDFWLTYGRYSREFEERFSEYLGVRFTLLVNSGSSANLLAFMSLTSPLLGERKISRGDEVITVAAGFPTTVAPIVQYGAIPVFVDVDSRTANLDPALLENALSERTRAVMIAHTLGNPFDLRRIRSFCDRHGLWLVEDNCDALGSRYDNRFTGTWGDLATSSFYPPHHMTTGEGGAVYTNDPLLKKIALSLRDWGRDCWCDSGKDGTCGHRFTRQYGRLPPGYDHKYVYSHFGYNLKATDMQAAVGCAQLDKLPFFTERRKEHFRHLSSALRDLPQFQLMESYPESDPSWFGFLVTVLPGAGFARNDLTRYLESKKIQTRNLFAGNLIKHPCFESLREGLDYRISGTLQNTDRIMNDAFWIGLYPGMTPEKLDYMADAILSFTQNKRNASTTL